MMIATTKIIRKLRRLRAVTADSILEKGLFLGTRNYQKFIILCTGRTGSNLLCSLLQSHSNIRAFAEVLYKDPKRKRIHWDYPGYNSEEIWQIRERNPNHFIDEIVFRKFPLTVSAVGFKLFYNHGQNNNNRCIWDHLNQIKNLKIIHLKRENLLEQYISLKKAKATRQWINKSKNNNYQLDDFNLTIEKNDCLKHFQEVRHLEQKYDDFFRDHHILNVSYENLVKDYISETKKIQIFLGTSYQKLYSSTYKQSQQPISHIINNYAELKESFQGTYWSSFFDKK